MSTIFTVLNIVNWPEGGRLWPKRVVKCNLIVIIESCLDFCFVLTVRNILFKLYRKDRFMRVRRADSLIAGTKLQVIHFQGSSFKWFTSRQNCEAVNRRTKLEEKQLSEKNK